MALAAVVLLSIPMTTSLVVPNTSNSAVHEYANRSQRSYGIGYTTTPVTLP
jgi:hypothetical protein